MNPKSNFLWRQLVGVGIVGLVLLWGSPLLAESLSIILRHWFDEVTSTAFCMVPIAVTGGVLLWGACYGLIRLALQKGSEDEKGVRQ